MPSGRTPEIAKRNANIQRRYARGERPAALAFRYGLTRQQIHRIVADPNATVPTVKGPAQIVRPLDPPSSKKYKGIPHGTEAGYREELRRGLATCDDCKEAHAVIAKRYNERRKAKIT